MTYQVAEDGYITKVLADERVLVLPPEDNGTPEWAEYLAWQQSQGKVRARNEDGTYKGDDPATPDVNEAWTDGR